MKTLGLIIDTSNLKLQDMDKDKSSQELVSAVIKNVILSWGMEKKSFFEDDRRKYYKICDAFETAVKDGKESVELEDDWFGLIRKAFRETALIPNDLLRLVEETINSVKDR